MKNGLLLLVVMIVQVICQLAFAYEDYDKPVGKWCRAFSNEDILVGIASSRLQGNKVTHRQLDQNAKDTCTRFVTCEVTGGDSFIVVTGMHDWCRKSANSKEKALTLTAPLDSPWGNICAVAFLQTQNKLKCHQVAKGIPTRRNYPPKFECDGSNVRYHKGKSVTCSGYSSTPVIKDCDSACKKRIWRPRKAEL